MSQQGRILIVGAGGYGRAVAEAVLLSGSVHGLVGFLDDLVPPATLIFERPVLGAVSVIGELREHFDSVVVAIGNNKTREALHARVREAGASLVTVIHPRAIISPSAAIGPGSSIMAGAVVGTEATLGEGVIVNVGAAVDHHCRVGDFAHLGVGASMAGASTLGRGAWMQAGSAIAYRVSVPAGAVLGPAEGRTER